MGLPRKLKNLSASIMGGSYLGKVAAFTQPKLALATDDWRGGGMIGPVKIEHGLEAMEAEIEIGGHERELFRLFGDPDVGGTRIRLIEAFQADDGSAAQAVEIYIAGRFTEIDPGTSKPKDDTSHKYKVALAYYRRVVDGFTEIEIDMLAGVFIVGGVDRYAEIMSILTS